MPGVTKPGPKTATNATPFLTLLKPATKRRIQKATDIADRWLSLTVAQKIGPDWTKRWATTEEYAAWVVARRAANRAVARDWLARRAFDALLRSMFPLWRRPRGFVDSALVPQNLAGYEWVIDALLAELADPTTLRDELHAQLALEVALDVLLATWTSASATLAELAELTEPELG